MATFTHVSTGAILLKGCSGVGKSVCIPFRFAEGSIVYLCQKARQGVLEAVAVKKVLLNGGPYFYLPMYKDTFNSIYEERELCTRAEAVDNVRAYYQKQLELVDRALQQTCP